MLRGLSPNSPQTRCFFVVFLLRAGPRKPQAQNFVRKGFVFLPKGPFFRLQGPGAIRKVCEKGGRAPLLTDFRHLQAPEVEKRVLLVEKQTLFGQNSGPGVSGGQRATKKQRKNIEFAESSATIRATRKRQKITKFLISGL